MDASLVKVVASCYNPCCPMDGEDFLLTPDATEDWDELFTALRKGKATCFRCGWAYQSEVLLPQVEGKVLVELIDTALWNLTKGEMK